MSSLRRSAEKSSAARRHASEAMARDAYAEEVRGFGKRHAGVVGDPAGRRARVAASDSIGFQYNRPSRLHPRAHSGRAPTGQTARQ